MSVSRTTNLQTAKEKQKNFLHRNKGQHICSALVLSILSPCYCFPAPWQANHKTWQSVFSCHISFLLHDLLSLLILLQLFFFLCSLFWCSGFSVCIHFSVLWVWGLCFHSTITPMFTFDMLVCFGRSFFMYDYIASAENLHIFSLK